MANQYTANTILYVTPQGKPITELRRSGNNLVLYTEDNQVLQRFRHWKTLERLQPYYQGSFIGPKKWIAADLYFPYNRRVRKMLVLALRGQGTLTRQKVSVR